MPGSTLATTLTKTAEQVLWEAVPDLFVQWLAAQPDYDRLHKAACELPGLERVPHVVYALPHADLLHVGADVGLEKASEWSDLLRKDGIRCVTFPGAVAPLCYGYEPWMLVKQSADPRLIRPRYPLEGFAGPYPLAAALAGSVMACGTGGFVEKQGEYSDTPLREALRAARTLLAPAPAVLIKAAAAMRAGGKAVPVRPEEFSVRAWADPTLSVATKAAASGLVAAAAYGRESAAPEDLARVSAGLGASPTDGLLVGRTLSALEALGPEKQAMLQRSRHWGMIVARSVGLAFGLAPKS